MLIELVDVGFTYMPGTPMEQVALKGITLGIGEEEFVALTGPTGSGKSTLIQHLNGLLTPTEGKVLFRGREVGRDVRAHEIRREVGLVFQFPESQLFEETVAEDVAFGPRNLGLSDDEIAERVEEALEAVGLDYDSIAGRSPFGLSGGEKRLVAIAGVLAMKPRLLVLDEPTSGLDAHGKRRIMECLTDLRLGGMTIVLVTHDMDEVADYADRLIVLNGGGLALSDAPEVVFAEVERVKDLGLTVPKTVEMLRKLRERGFDSTTSPVSLRAAVEAICAAVKEGQCQ